MRQKKTLEPLGHSIQALIHNNQWGSRLKEMEVFDLWKGAVGEQIAKNATPVQVHQGVLLVQVASSPWLNELKFHKESIIRNLNDKLGNKIIREIDFKHVTRYRELEKPVDGRTRMLFNHPPTSGRVNLNLYPITSEGERFAKRVAACVADEKLREVLRRILLAHVRMKTHLKIKGYKPCVRCGTLTGRKSGECYFCGKKGSLTHW